MDPEIEERIRARAHVIWEKEGRPHGKHLEHWERAKRLIAAEEQRAHVQEALRRLDAGEYGRCIDCGAELSAARLEAKPEAARCVTCQGKAESAR